MRVESWLVRAARTRPGRAAVNAVTYEELLQRARAGTGALSAMGAQPGARVAIALPPGEDFAVALHAIWLLGAIAVPHDLRLTEAERAPADFVVGEPLPRAGAPAALQEHHDLAAVAVGLQTSGTTSAPKPIDLTFGNFLWSALGSGVALGVDPDERWLSTLPFSHVGGLSIVVRSAIYATTAVVHERWETDRALHALSREQISLVSVVPTTLARLLDAGLSRNDGASALRCALVGGGPVPPELMRRAQAAGVPFAQTYGLTEACSQVTTARPGDTQPDAGPALFCTRVRVAADGEIHVAGPTLAAGGELATGDLGALDADGRLTVTGRKSDTIVSGGENVAPAEVEAVLVEHPAVAEAAVHGRPHPEWGEAVVATVVLRAGAHATDAELRRHCLSRLAGFKVPKQIDFAAVLPRTPSGKLQRRRLR